MAYTWISTADGDPLRPDPIRQIDMVEVLRGVPTSGNHFLVADSGENVGTARLTAKTVPDPSARDAGS
jgi:hypothetical protein